MSPRLSAAVVLPFGLAVPCAAALPSSQRLTEAVCTLETPLTAELAIAAKRYASFGAGFTMNPKLGESLAVLRTSCPMPFMDPNHPETLMETLRRQSCAASAVVSGVVKAGRFYLTPTRDWIFGEYDVEVHEVVRTSAGISIEPGSALLMMRTGGAVCAANGGRMEADHNLDPLPAIGGRYLLFLEWDPKAKRYYSADLGFKLDDSAQIERLAERPVDVDDGVTPAVLLEEARFASGGCAE